MAQNGYLTSRIYTSSLPVEGAIITVIKRENGTQEIIGKRTTNRNGLIAPITISAPDEALSLEPSDATVFATVDVRVDKEGFYTVEIKDVQIFGGQTTVVDTPLIPLPDNQSFDNRAEEFVQTPQNL